MIEFERFRLGVASEGEDSLDEADEGPVAAKSKAPAEELLLEVAAAAAAAITAATEVNGGAVLPLLFRLAPRVRE